MTNLGRNSFQVHDRERIGANATLWSVPDAGHVAALQAHPHDDTTHVTCAGYLVYLFEDDERKVRIEGP